MGRRSRRTDIVRAATRLFANKGINGVSMADVAKAADLRTASVYRHFHDKEDLFEAVLHFLLDEGDTYRRNYLQSSATPEEKIKATVYFAIHDSPALVNHRKILQRALVDEDTATLKFLRKFQGQQIKLVVDNLRKIDTGMDANFMFYILLATMLGFVDLQPLYQMIRKPSARESDAKHLTETILSRLIPKVDWRKVHWPSESLHITEKKE